MLAALEERSLRTPGFQHNMRLTHEISNMKQRRKLVGTPRSYAQIIAAALCLMSDGVGRQKLVFCLVH